MSIGKQITVWRVRPNDMQAIAPGEVLNTGYDLILKSEHDAALRRAKAEGMREAAIRAREFSKPYSMEWWRTMTKTGISAAMCRDVADALDARAAQIEEGE